MGDWVVTGPDGQQYDVHGPETQQDAIDFAKEQAAKGIQATTEANKATPPPSPTGDQLRQENSLVPSFLDPNNLMDAFRNYTSKESRILADATTRGAADQLTGRMGDNTVAGEQAKTEEAKATGGVMGEALNTLGTAVPYFAVPGGALSTPIKAMATGGIVNAIDTTAQSLIKKQEMPSMSDIALSTGLGAVSSLAGFYVGKLIQAHYGETPKIDESFGNTLQNLDRSETAAATEIADSKARVSEDSYKKVVQGIKRGINRDPEMAANMLTGADSPTAQKALARLDRLAGKKIDPSAETLYNVYKNIRDSTRNMDHEVTALSGDKKIVDYISGQLRDFLGGLDSAAPGVVLRGDGGRASKAFLDLEDLAIMKDKTAAVAGMMKRAAYAAYNGTPYDEAIQRQFQGFLAPSGSGRTSGLLDYFSKSEMQALEELAKGGIATRAFNKLDDAFGHGVFGQFFNAFRLVGQPLMAGGPEKAVGGLMQDIVPTFPKANVIPQQVGAAAGAAVLPPMVPRLSDRQQQ